MILSPKLVLAALTVLFVLVRGCDRGKPRALDQPGSGPGRGHHYGQQKDRAFAIYIYTDTDGYCYVDTPGVILWKAQTQTVQWISDDSNDYLVDFTRGHNGSPFSKTTFPVPGNVDLTPSGALNSKSPGYYDYVVWAGLNPKPTDKPCKETTDPGVYIK